MLNGDFVLVKKTPADIPSRGLDLSKSERREKWLHGPDFLCNTKDCWPRKKMDMYLSSLSLHYVTAPFFPY